MFGSTEGAGAAGGAILRVVGIAPKAPAEGIFGAVLSGAGFSLRNLSPARLRIASIWVM